jgi:hypothetical protein
LGRRGHGWRGADAAQVADPVVVPDPGWPGVPAQTGRRTAGCGRARRGDRVRGARGEPAPRGPGRGPVPPDQSLARVAISPDVVVQLSGVIGAPPLLAAAAALLRRFRLAAALVAATLLKVSLESVAKTLVQRGRPAQTVPDVILRGNSAAHGLSFPSGHAMVIFAITALGRRRGGGSRHIDRERAQPGVRHARHQVQDSQREPVPVSSTPRTPRGGRIPTYTRLPSIPRSPAGTHPFTH